MENRSNNFQTHLNQTWYGTLAIARIPIKTPEVGTIRFVIPSPSWNASTAVCLEIPMRSLKGAMMGIVRAA